MILLDTNVLLRLIQIGHPHQQPALDALTLLRTRDHEQFFVFPQVIYEMYTVCTRPVTAPNAGLGLSAAEAMMHIDRALRQFTLLADPATVFERWRELVLRHDVSGKATHDARLVATMIEHRIPRLLTFNDAHFVRYTEIGVLNPFDAIGVSRK